MRTKNMKTIEASPPAGQGIEPYNDPSALGTPVSKPQKLDETTAHDVITYKTDEKPPLDLFSPDMLPLRKRVEEWRTQVDQLSWPVADDDDAGSVEELVGDAFELAKRYDLSVFTRVMRTKDGLIDVIRYVSQKIVGNLPDLVHDEVRDMINRAATLTKVRYDNRPGKDVSTVPPTYFQPTKEKFWMTDSHGVFRPYGTESYRRHLQNHGLSVKQGDDGSLSEADAYIVRLQKEECLDAAGEFAGYRQGLHAANGLRFLASRECRLVKPSPGEWPVIKALLEGLYGTEQEPWLRAHLKYCLESLMEEQIDCGQAVITVGPPDCGKSLFLEQVIVPLLGGRSASAYKFLLRQKGFNAELQRAEVWRIDDEDPVNTYDTRRTLGGSIKKVCGSPNVPCEGKFKDVVELPLYKRLFICINDQDMDCLPDLNASVVDKVLLFKAHKFDMPVGLPPLPGTKEEREKFRNVLAEELPHFAHCLLGWKVPDELRGRRYQVKPYANPELMESIKDTCPDEDLFHLVQTVLFRSKSNLNRTDLDIDVPSVWRGSAAQLKDVLLSSDKEKQLQFFCRSATALGTRLASLAKARPDFVSYERPDGARLWQIRGKEIQVNQPSGLRRAGRTTFNKAMEVLNGEQ